MIPHNSTSGDGGVVGAVSGRSPQNPTDFHVSPLVELSETDGHVCCSKWDATCSRWAAGTDDGRVHVWEKRGAPGSLGKMQRLATWQASPLDPGKSLRRSITHLAWAPPSFGTQLAVCCCAEGAAGEGSGPIREGDIGIWGPMPPFLESPDRAGDAAAPAEQPNRTPSWRQLALLQVPQSVTGSPSCPSRRILSLRFLSVDAEGSQPLLLLAAVSAEGKLLVFQTGAALRTAPDWHLRDELPLVTEAMTCPGWANLSSARLAVHPSCCSLSPSAAKGAAKQGSIVALAVALQKQAPASPSPSEGGLTRPASSSTCAQVWAYSRRHMRWYAAADLLATPVKQQGSIPGDARVHDVAWCPQLMGHPYDTIALASSQGLLLLRLSSASPSSSSPVLGPPDAPLAVTPVGLQGTQEREEVLQVSWHWTGTLLAAVSSEGQISVWKEGLQGLWARESTVGNLSN